MTTTTTATDLDAALTDMAGVLADGMTAQTVGPAMTCREADALARVLAVAGHPDRAAEWLTGHALGTADDADEHDDRHWPVVTAAHGLPADATRLPDTRGGRVDYRAAVNAARAYVADAL